MAFFSRLITILVANAVVLWGLSYKDWSGPTALVIYWFENLFQVASNSLRIALHRRWTRKHGHYRPQLGVEVTTNGQKNDNITKTFFSEFLVTGLVFCMAHAVFLVAVLALVVREGPDLEAAKFGCGVIAAAQTFGLLFDLFGLREKSFLWVKRLAQLTIGRIALMHLAILGGIAIAALSGRNNSFYLPFAILKLLVEVGSLFQSEKRVTKAPGWLVRLMNRVRPGEDFAAYLEAENAKELAAEARDEEVRV